MNGENGCGYAGFSSMFPLRAPFWSRFFEPPPSVCIDGVSRSTWGASGPVAPLLESSAVDVSSSWRQRWAEMERQGRRWVGAVFLFGLVARR